MREIVSNSCLYKYALKINLLNCHKVLKMSLQPNFMVYDSIVNGTLTIPPRCTFSPFSLTLHIHSGCKNGLNGVFYFCR